MSENNLVVFEHVSKSYQESLALDDISFELKQGEIFGYIGPNGAGKTTTIKILVGLIQNFKGNYSIDNNNMPDNFANVQSLLGYLPQNVAFQEWRTLDHALKTYGTLSGLDEEKLENRIIEILDLLELSDVRHKKIIQLSGGMVQKVGLAQAILHTPKFLVLDEPLSGLDPTSRYTMKAIIKDLSEKGTTIFFSSHILSDVQDVADRIAILNKGKVIKIGTLDALKSDFSITHDIEILLSYNSRALSELNSFSFIKNIRQLSDSRIIIYLDRNADIDESCHRIIKRMLKLNFRIRSFQPVDPDIDSVYLKYIKGDKTN